MLPRPVPQAEEANGPALSQPAACDFTSEAETGPGGSRDTREVSTHSKSGPPPPPLPTCASIPLLISLKMFKPFNPVILHPEIFSKEIINQNMGGGEWDFMHKEAPTSEKW